MPEPRSWTRTRAAASVTAPLRSVTGARISAPGPSRQAPEEGFDRPLPGPLPPGSPSPGGSPALSPHRMGGAAPRSWTVELPAGLELLSMNGREHYQVRNRKFQALKTAAWATLRNAKLPLLDRVTVRVICDPPDKRLRDPDNLVVKPFVDAIVAAGILPGDDKRHVAWAHAEITGEVHRPSRLRMVITDVSDAGGRWET